MSEAAWHNWLARHGQTQQEWIDEAVRTAKNITQDHERLHALLASYEGKAPQKIRDEDFEYGLDRILDGLQARLDAAS